MKTQRTLKIIRFCLPGVLAAAWWGTTPHAQEKPAAVLLWQNGGIGQKEELTDGLNSSQRPKVQNLKSENKALALSLLGSLIPATVGVTSAIAMPAGVAPVPGAESDAWKNVGLLVGYSGLIVGPSLGYFYAGQVRRGLVGVGIRVASGAALVRGLKIYNDGGSDFGTALYSLGSVFLLYSIIDDITSVKGVVQKRNRSLQEKTVTITPTYFAQHGAPGLKVQLQF
ncbi:MAG: hypothetical protein L0196_06050 [candidate division Zixibacteria bacterium]|nr:hypothetical protein [candidate division Zixibacteria bacterium]